MFDDLISNMDGQWLGLVPGNHYLRTLTLTTQQLWKRKSSYQVDTHAR